MNNTQKILVIIGIMLFIIILDIWTCKEADNLVNNVLGDLDNLKELLLNENFEESKSKSEELNKKWSELLIQTTLKTRNVLAEQPVHLSHGRVTKF